MPGACGARCSHSCIWEQAPQSIWVRGKAPQSTWIWFPTQERYGPMARPVYADALIPDALLQSTRQSSSSAISFKVQGCSCFYRGILSAVWWRKQLWNTKFAICTFHHNSCLFLKIATKCAPKFFLGLIPKNEIHLQNEGTIKLPKCIVRSYGKKIWPICVL